MVLFLAASAFLIQIPFAQAYTGTITYSAGTDTITAVGGTSGTPITFNDLYLADVAGGWNQITVDGSDSYYIQCKLIIGNGSTTYFTDLKKLAFFDSVFTANSQALIEVKASATLTLGVVQSSTNKTGKDGCVISSKESGSYSGYMLYNNGGIIYCYGSYFYGIGTQAATIYGYSGQIRLWSCSYQKNCYLRGNCDPQNCLVINPSLVWQNPPTGASSSGVVVDNCYDIFKVQDTVNITWQDYKVLKITHLYLVQTNGNPVNGHNYFINCEFPTWSFTWSTSTECRYYRQYTYDLIVLNGEITDFVEDANVTLSKGGVQIGTWLTNSSGQIETQTLTYGYYNYTGGDTMYDGSNPFVLTVTHEDWADYTSRFYVTEKTKMTISMQDTTTANNAALIWSLLFGALAFALFLAWRVRR